MIKPYWQIGLLWLGTTCASAHDPPWKLDDLVPSCGTDCIASRNERLRESALALEAWAATQVLSDWRSRPLVGLARLERVILAKQHIDGLLNDVICLRTTFVELPAGPARREHLRNYLQAAAHLIDLSGRLRYLLRDAVNQVAFAVSRNPEQLDSLFDLLAAHRLTIGASVMTAVLFDPPEGSAGEPYPEQVKRRALRLCKLAPQADVLPALAQFARRERTTTPLLILAAEAIRTIGLPQDRQTGQDPQLPLPAITASELYRLLVDREEVSEVWRSRHQQLVTWCRQRAERGVTGDRFRVAGFDVALGDWLLMRNPSPYNLFTDLSPGLFTHVGVVGEDKDEQGRRRIIIVDLPERGDRIPATAVDTYLQRTVHYFFVRHRDPAVGRQMGRVASALVGNPSQFDLTFRTSRVAAWRGKLSARTRIHTYCAGFLLLCAQETSAPRSEFFPISEIPAGKHCPQNLAQLGLAMGDDFVSPTGAIFSPQLKIVARREPMYSPAREIKETIYDYFAQCMIEKRLTPSPDAYQALREKLASLAKYNPWLAQALARANGVSQHLDLEAAAKAAAVIETLDEIADRQRDEFLRSRRALLAGPRDQLEQQGVSPQLLARFRSYREQHADLFRRLTAGQLPPRALRIALVDYYSRLGQQQLADRFFRSDQARLAPGLEGARRDSELP